MLLFLVCPGMEGIRALLEEKDVLIKIAGMKVLVSQNISSKGLATGSSSLDPLIKIIPFAEIHSLHVKSDEDYSLEIVTEKETVVLNFRTHHCRDIVKSIILFL